MTMNEQGIYTAVHKIRKTVTCEPMDKAGLLYI
jgi:hypothetical protein